MPLVDTFHESTHTEPSGYLRIARTGTVTGPGASAHFESQIAARFESAHPSPDFTVRRTVTLSNDLASVAYELTAEGRPGAGAGKVVGGILVGRSVTTVRRGPGLRQLRTVRHDAVGDDPAAVAQALRQSSGDAVPYEERVMLTAAPRPGVRVIQTFLESADASGLLDWRQILETKKGLARTLAHAYPGADPILTAGPLEPGLWVQRGYAVGLKKFPREPAPVSTRFAELPVVRFETPNDHERKTTWRYVFTQDPNTDPPPATLALIARPTNLTFYSTTPG